ncbi:type II secretion system protein [Nocardioides sp. WS12]|uniref:PulJ/GspJ family protein n=1 Tax=Nocardioides sp. WS12 TaxID=2486272 RepID=UPI0015F9BA9F|nr:type II secretion system protein [Nocardioides sp. WS12]
MRLIERVRHRYRRRDDAGFTLIELLITVIIMGAIAAGVAGVLISYLKFSVDTQSRMTESLDVQFAASYWQRDVASIGVRTYDSGSKSFPLAQSVDVTPACTMPTGTRVVTLAWSEYDPLVLDSTVVGPTVTVSYVAKPDGTAFDLVRVRCTGSTIDSSIEVAHSLNAVPTRACDISCTGTGSNVPAIVELSLSILDPDGNGGAAYSATLTGERRQT